MQRVDICRIPAGRGGFVVVLAATLALVACGDVNFDSNWPRIPNSPGGAGDRILQISGSLTTEQGTCLEATVLYDGAELAGASTVCPQAEGCARLGLSAVTRSTSGHHTVSFKVLRQSPEAVSYLAELRVRVSREGLPFVLTMSPQPRHATLRPGESVTFDLEFFD